MLYSEIQFPLYLLCYDLSHFSAIARISCWRSSNVIHTCLPSQRLGNFTRSSVIEVTTPAALNVWCSIHRVWAHEMDSEWIIRSKVTQRRSQVTITHQRSLECVVCWYIPYKQTQIHTGIAKEMSRFEDTFWHPLTYSLLLPFSVTELCCDEFYTISRNSPVREWDIYRDPEKSSPINIAKQETESVWKH